jgi:SsrA-binding protein
MAKSKSKPKAKDDGEDVIVNITKNRRAKHDYELSDAVECGIVLVGTEVKSLRDGHVQLDEAYAKIEDGELFLVGCEIPEYTFGNRLNHVPKRQRKLLLHRREIKKLIVAGDQKGFTLVPLQMYFKNGRAKVEIALGRGKQTYDKRQSLKKNEAKRDIDRAMAAKRRR